MNSPAFMTRYSVNTDLSFIYVVFQESDELPSIHDEILSKHRLEFYPRVFDTLSCQLAKLYMTSLCGNTGEDQDGKARIFLLVDLQTLLS